MGWRWLLERTDSPWYPTARLYRQPSPGDWDAVVQRVRADLDVVRLPYSGAGTERRAPQARGQALQIHDGCWGSGFDLLE